MDSDPSSEPPDWAIASPPGRTWRERASSIGVEVVSSASCVSALCRSRCREGTQNLQCTYLAAAVLAGLLANALFGLWWLDPVVVLCVAGLAVREDVESWRGEEGGC
ncbi:MULTISPECIES: hypothetical protein [Streptomyces]|uniref:hypothetical protein n=1 Tax=Streptomyces TaxID=1883 RepID=UPI002E2A0894|nr:MULTISPECIES: hypothetical protein [Streptomyces]